MLDKKLPKLISQIEYPGTWKYQAQDYGFEIVSQENINSTKRCQNSTLLHSVHAAGLLGLDDTIGNFVNQMKQAGINFELIASQRNEMVSDNRAHKVVYSYTDNQNNCTMKGMAMFIVSDKKVYRFIFSAEQDKFYSDLRIVESIIDSIKFLESPMKINKSGLPLNGSPVDLVVDAITNRLYVANPEARQIQVIDTLTDRVIQNISIGAYPSTLALNQFKNRLYVTSPETDMIYVVDGLTNNITSKIKVGPMVGDIAVDTNDFSGHSTLVFVTNRGNNSVSIIDDMLGTVVSNMPTGLDPFGIGIDALSNRAYIATLEGIDIIDYFTNSNGRNVISHKLNNNISKYVHFPSNIVVDSNTSKAYITNSGNDTVSVIDTSSNKQVDEIQVGLFPTSIAFDPNDKKLYIANTGNNTVSVIDTSNETDPRQVSIDSIPYDVAVNPNTDIVYFANPESRTVSTLDSNTDLPVSAVVFRINPPGAGHIECKKDDKNWTNFSVNRYQRIVVGTECKAISNSGFKFSSWAEGEPSSNFTGPQGNLTWYAMFPSLIGHLFEASTNNQENSTRPIEQYGTYTANFLSSTAILQALSPIISVAALLLVILLAAIAPTLRLRRKTRVVKKERSERKEQAVAILAGQADKIESSEERGTSGESPHLSKSEILTIDATVLIGVLVFLSLTEGFETSEQYQINIITASIVFPFAISAIVGVARREGFATRLMIAGFINLMISVMLIAGMKL
jgi:YVTN family beta-propeller protein